MNAKYKRMSRNRNFFYLLAKPTASDPSLIPIRWRSVTTSFIFASSTRDCLWRFLTLTRRKYLPGATLMSSLFWLLRFQCWANLDLVLNDFDSSYLSYPEISPMFQDVYCLRFPLQKQTSLKIRYFKSNAGASPLFLNLCLREETSTLTQGSTLRLAVHALW